MHEKVNSVGSMCGPCGLVQNTVGNCVRLISEASGRWWPLWPPQKRQAVVTISEVAGRGDRIHSLSYFETGYKIFWKCFKQVQAFKICFVRCGPAFEGFWNCWNGFWKSWNGFENFWIGFWKIWMWWTGLWKILKFLESDGSIPVWPTDLAKIGAPGLANRRRWHSPA